MLKTCKKRKLCETSEDRDYAARVRYVVAAWFAESTTDAPDLDENKDDYMSRRLKTLAAEWEEGKPCHFDVCHIEIQRTTNLKVWRIGRWFAMLRRIDRFGFRPIPNGYLKKVHCHRLVATPECVFWQVRDQLEYSEIRLVMKSGDPYHRIFAITVGVVAAEEVLPTHHANPLLQAERIIRSTYARNHDYEPWLQTVPHYTAPNGWSDNEWSEPE